ncbi:hypothetical protein [Massilia sp. WF1]|uniref:hypothetical protein n=1 Tax=Massilia sp. WF1 TaxID=1406431 RepID=UPI0012E1C202|nr:hypothetical protein [Massilia sp. WF1]
MKNRIVVVAAMLCSPFIAGCEHMMETMVAHYNMGDKTLNHIALGNAMVNVCLANKAVDKNIAYAYSNVSAQLLDISVLDRDQYKQIYQTNFDRLTAEGGDIKTNCSQLEQYLPKVTQDYANSYMNIASDLSLARAQERQQMAAMMSNFGTNWSKPIAPITYTWPNISYANTQPSGENYLVKTSYGLLKCRVTNKYYVFCI